KSRSIAQVTSHDYPDRLAYRYEERLTRRLADEPATAGELSELKFEEDALGSHWQKGYDRSGPMLLRGIRVAGVVLARKRAPHRTRLLRRRFARGLYARHLQGDPQARACLKRLSPDHRPFSSSQGSVLRPSRPE